MTSTTGPVLTIVLLSYNSRNYLEQFLPGLIENTPKEYPIVVVNNGSTDDTEDFLSEHYPELRVITILKNKGFTNGYVESLSQIESDHYCLLSSDVEVSPGWTEAVMKVFAEDEKVAACQPKIKSWHRRNEFEYAGACGGYLDKYGYLFCRGRLFYTVEEDKGQYNETAEVFWASGACFFVKSSLYHKLGGLDDDFYAHMEEVDLCWRMKNAGYKIMSVPASEVFHVGGSIISYGSPGKTFRNYRNNLILLMKNLPAAQLIWKLPYRLVLDGVAFFHLLFTGQFILALTIIRSHFSFHSHFFYWLKRRKECQSMVKKGVRTTYYNKSIVWDYFISGKKYFSQLNWKA